jgi:hypothetical protein
MVFVFSTLAITDGCSAVAIEFFLFFFVPLDLSIPPKSDLLDEKIFYFRARFASSSREKTAKKMSIYQWCIHGVSDKETPAELSKTPEVLGRARNYDLQDIEQKVLIPYSDKNCTPDPQRIICIVPFDESVRASWKKYETNARTVASCEWCDGYWALGDGRW